MTTTTTATADRETLDAQAYEALAANDGNAAKAGKALGAHGTTVTRRAARHAARLAENPEPVAPVAAADVTPDEYIAARQAEHRAETAADKPAAAPKARKRDPRFPDGVVTPVEFQHYLIAEGLVPADFTQNYNLLRRSGFPFRHYGPDGTAYDEPQAADGKTVTRPGVDRAAARDWFTASR